MSGSTGAAAGAAAGTGGAGAAAGAAGTAATPWYQGKVDDVLVGHWKNKGYDVNDPVAVATAATKAHIEAEKFVGAPANELLRMPKADDAVATAAFWERLGAPKEAAGYTFEGLKAPDGSDLSPSFTDAMRATFAANRIPAPAANGIAKGVLKYMAGAEAEETAQKAATIQTERDALKKDWGAAFDGNLLAAQNAIRNLGIKPEAVTALENAAGYSAVMNMFRNIGVKIGEAPFIDTSGGSNNMGVMSGSQAAARLDELKADEAWTKRLLAGDFAATREFQNLTSLMAQAKA